MRFIEKKVKANQETFAPELLVTVSIPLELMNTDIKLGEDAMAYEKIGEEFINILKSQSNNPTQGVQTVL
jgi:hypothetical protein